MVKRIRSLVAALLGFTAVMGPWLAGCGQVVETTPVQEPEVQETAEPGDSETLDQPSGDTLPRAGVESNAPAFVLVEVRDAAGEAVANIPVAPTRLIRDGRTMFMGGPVQTGPDGIAKVPTPWGLWEPYEGPIYVELMGILKTPIKREVSEHGPLRVELCAPGMGEVIVSTPGVSGAKDARRPERAVELWQGDLPMGNMEVQLRGAHRPIVQGDYQFDHIEIGQQISARISRGGRVEAQVSFVGPSTVGEVVLVSLERDGPGLTGRLVDVNARPLADLAVTAYQSPKFGAALLEFRTDSDGILQWTDFRPRQEWSPAVKELVFVIEQENPHEAPWAPFLFEVPRDWMDLGTRTVERLEEIVAGVVVDESGSPIEGAQVRLDLRSNMRLNWDRVRIEGLRMIDCRSDASGGFAVFARSEPGEYRLIVRAEGYLPVVRELSGPGVAEMEIVLAESASLVGEVVADPGFDTSVLVIEVVDSSAQPGIRGSVDEEGKFSLDGIPPGLVEPRIVLPNGQTVLVLERTELIGGEKADMGRIDLRGRVFSRVVSVFGKRGIREMRTEGGTEGRTEGRTKGGKVGGRWVLPSTGLYGQAWDRAGRFAGMVDGVVDPGPARLRIVSLGESVEIKIKVVGFRETDWVSVSGDREVVLEWGER